MFRVSLVHLSADASRAAPGLPRVELDHLGSAELIALLESFRNIDPLDNVDADAEMYIEYNRSKFLVQTSQGKLLLHDVRKRLEPALVLSPEGVLAEIDGSAAAARTQVPFASFTVVTTPEPEPVAAVAPRGGMKAGPKAALIAAVLGCAAYLGYPLVANAGADDAGVRYLSGTAESDAACQDVAGVYMSGNKPADFGLALNTDYTLKLFQLNTEGTPSLIRDTFRIGRINGDLCIVSHQPGGLIRVTGKDTVTFCGVTYERVK